MNFAPVIIPTLNRAEHLRRCLESLKQNNGADKTEIYISVDYPPAEKYKEGYKEVKKLLSETDLSCFKNVYVFNHRKNKGPVGNSDFLKEKIKKDGYDRYIYTEDDNEFSTNFLVYMNEALQKFEANEDVIAVCGAKDTSWETKGKNIAYCKLLAAYGVGEWLDKTKAAQQKAKEILLPKKIYGPKRMFSFLKKNACLFNLYVLNILCADKGFYWPQENELRFCDSTYSIYMHLSDAICIAPAVAKSRTWGNDGSGVNMAERDINPEQEWELDKNTDFVCDDTENLEFLNENYALGNAYLSSGQAANTAKALLCYGLILLCGRDRNRVLKIVNKIRKALKK